MTRILKRCTETLATELTQAEFNLKARELAETHEAIALEREDQKEKKGEMKQRLERLEGQRNDLMRVVKARAEVREVEVEVHADDARSVALSIRMDTGEVYSERPLTPTERQLGLGLVEAPATASLTGTVTFTDPDSGLPLTMTLDELKRASKKLQKAAGANPMAH